jgi:hypothetical protein
MRAAVLLVALACTSTIAAAEPRPRGDAAVAPARSRGDVAVATPRPRGSAAVRIASSSDASPGVLDAHARRRHGEIVRRALVDVLHRSGTEIAGIARVVASAGAAGSAEDDRRDGRHAGIAPRQIAPRQIDVTVVAWKISPEAMDVSVTAELRAVVCDHHGKMLSIVTGRARVSAPARFARIAELREQALAEAVGGMSQSLHSQLVRPTS